MKFIVLNYLLLATAILNAQENRFFASFSTNPPGTRGYAWHGLAGASSTTRTFHAGIDYLGALGSPITAVGSGRVVSVFKAGLGDRGLGNSIIIQHSMSTPLFSLYGHLNSIDPMVSVGRYVSKGQLIGTMGRTGVGSNNIVHLHFELKTINSLSNTSNVGVGYTTVHPDQMGYRNPANFFGVAQYGDFTLASANPTLARRGGGLIAKPLINNPFSQPSNLDLRLQVLTSTGTPIRDLATIFNQTLSIQGNMGFTLSTSAHGLSAGTYRLRLLYKAASSTTWFTLPFGTANNPWTLTVTN